MNKPSALDMLRHRKKQLQTACHQQEQRLHSIIEYAGDNFLSLGARSVAQSIRPAASPLSNNLNGASDTPTSPWKNIFKMIPMSFVYSLLAKTALKTIARRSQRKWTRRAVSMVSNPVVAFAWDAVQPTVVRFAKKRLIGLLKMVSKKTAQKRAD